MEYKIGDKYEVATEMLTMEIPCETKIMTLTKIYDVGSHKYYAFNNNHNVHYAVCRIIRKVE